jgi:hypothetical protein
MYYTKICGHQIFDKKWFKNKLISIWDQLSGREAAIYGVAHWILLVFINVLYQDLFQKSEQSTLVGKKYGF